MKTLCWYFTEQTICLLKSSWHAISVFPIARLSLANVDQLDRNSSYPVTLAQDTKVRPPQSLYQRWGRKGYECACRDTGVDNCFAV